MKPKYLPEKDIQQLEHLDPQQLANVPPEKISLLLRSYRLAANVAYTAWGFVKGERAAEDLERALHGYAPGHFSEPPSDVAVRIETLMQLYEDVEGMSVADQVRELIYQRIRRYQGQLEAGGR